MQLLDQHLEALGHACLLDRLALDDRLIGLHAADHVVGLHGEHLLEDVGGAVGLQCPYLHLAEALAAKLGLATEGLLRHKAVGAGGAGVDLVLDQVGELEHVGVADRHRVVEVLAGAPVIERHLAVVGQPSFHQVLLDLLLAGAIEDRGGDAEAEPGGGPAEVGLQDLANVHTRGHADRVEDDVHGAAIGQVGHVLDRQDAADHALIAVATGHLVAGADLALLAEQHAHRLVHAHRQLSAVVAREHLDIDHLAAHAVGHAQRAILHLAGLLAEDRAQQALLGRQVRLALRRDLTHEDVVRLHLSAHIDDAALVEVAQAILANIRDVARDLLGAELGIAGLHLVLLDMDRGEDILAHQALAH